MDHKKGENKELFENAKRIIREENQILISKRDRDLFFNALMGNENPPNEALLSAIKCYKSTYQST